jgi:hypothetical protein
MPKAGSTTIQQWLVDNPRLLADHSIRCVRIFRPDPGGPIALRPANDASAVSQFVANDAASRPQVVRGICDALGAAAEEEPAATLVVTNESYEVLFNAPGREDALAPLDDLAGAHQLRVAYYVRPQHSWLESAWLQWGFRNPLPPDVWIRRQRPRVDYFETRSVVRDAAPHVSFEVRPFRADLFVGGHVVNDFANTFLGLVDLPAEETRERWSNRSLPLEAAMLLRHAPPGLFWANQNDNKKFYPLKRIILEWDLPPSEVLARSREVLQRYAHATFEPGNRRLMQELGWNADHFVPPVAGDAAATDAPGSDDSAAEAGLRELNSLWETGASETERRMMFAALERLLAEVMP